MIQFHGVRAKTALLVNGKEAVNTWAKKKGLHKAVQEEFWVLCLDAENRIRHAEMVCKGWESGCNITPGCVFRAILLGGTARAILVHNHPSGSKTPSVEDIEYTRKLLNLAVMFDIKILDHVIVSQNEAASMRDITTLFFG